jgi:hypothetical protein
MSRDEKPRAPAEALSVLQIGTRLVEDYVVERILGAGGMGQVYLVRSDGTGQRFAVKRTLQRDEATRRKFLAELQTWVNLPEHPNLVACRFFRTLGEEVLIFSEFVDGGSLLEWIRGRRLASVDQVLDVAIQAARGLQAMHEARIVHQDVKPSNILLGTDGLVRVADFGLARFRQREETGTAHPSRAGSASGLTPAYCSPEQAAGRRLTRQTDVWSWGVTVLEMFTGEVTWASGIAAGEALKDYLATGAAPGLPAMPEALGNVLRRCFRKNPDDRWETMAALASAVANIFQRVIGREYEERAPRVKGRPRQAAPGPGQLVDRDWTNPRHWLIEARQAEGKSLEGLEGLLPPAQQTRRAQAVADFAVNEKARVVLLRLVKAGRDEFLPALACLYLDQAILSEHAGDHAVAGRLRDQVIKTYRHLVEGKGDRELAGELARALESKALGEQLRGHGREAAALYDQARAAREAHAPSEQAQVHHAELAALEARKADALAAAADWAGSEKAATSAITGLLEGAQASRDALAVHLATAYTTRGRALHERGDHRAAVLDAEAALAVCDRLARRRARSEAARREAADHLREAFTAPDRLYPEADIIQGVLAAAGHASILALGPLGPIAGYGAGLLVAAAVNVFRGRQSQQRHLKQVIESLTHVTEQEGHVELAGDFARMCKRLGVELLQRGNATAGASLFGYGYMQMLVFLRREGRHALATRLAAARLKDHPPPGSGTSEEPKGSVLFTMASYDRSVADYEYLVRGLDPTELAARTARAHCVRALALAGKEEADAAREACEQSLSIWKRLVEVEDRRELAAEQAEACLAAARVWAALHDRSRAQASCREAVAAYQTLIEHGQRGELTGRLEGARRLLAALNRGQD